jgi:hypothetical protein
MGAIFDRRSASVTMLLVIEIRARHVDEFGGLFLDGGDHVGMAVAGRGHGDAGREVVELVAIDVGDDDAAAALGHQRVGAGVGRRNIASGRRRGRASRSARAERF